MDWIRRDVVKAASIGKISPRDSRLLEFQLKVFARLVVKGIYRDEPNVPEHWHTLTRGFFLQLEKDWQESRNVDEMVEWFFCHIRDLSIYFLREGWNILALHDCTEHPDGNDPTMSQIARRSSEPVLENPW